MLSRQGPQSRVIDGKKWKGTVQGDRGNKSMAVDVVRLLKTQDIGYVRTMRSVVKKDVDRLREQVVFASEGAPVEDDDDDEEFDFGAGPVRPKKIVFVEEGEAPLAEDEENDEMDVEDEDDVEEGDFEGFDDDKDGDDADTETEAARKAKNLKRLRAELAVAETKLKALVQAERELEVQQAKMAKTATSGGTTKKGQKIMVRTRKR